MMAIIKTRWHAFWDNLNAREQRVLGTGAILVLVYCVYLIFAGLSQAIQDNTDRLTEKKAILIWMQQVKQQLKPQDKAFIKLDSAKALTVFADALEKTVFRKQPYQLEQTPDGGLQLSFERVSYHDFLVWLSQMTAAYQLDIQVFRAEKTDTAGVVRVMLMVGL